MLFDNAYIASLPVACYQLLAEVRDVEIAAARKRVSQFVEESLARLEQESSEIKQRCLAKMPETVQRLVPRGFDALTKIESALRSMLEYRRRKDFRQLEEAVFAVEHAVDRLHDVESRLAAVYPN